MNRPLRILQVVGGMNYGGVETWLMHVLRNVDREQYQMDFLVHTNRESSYDRELLSLGSQLHYCRSPRNPLQYAINFHRILKQSGPYDIVHSHVHLFSGYVLALARMNGVPVRIAHSHTCPRLYGRGTALLRAYRRASLTAIKSFSTDRIAVSRPAAESLFGPCWDRDSDTRIMYCGIDIRPFQDDPERDRVRAELGLHPADFVVGHVGRFVPVKNHCFLLQVARHVIDHRPQSRFLLIGDGPLIGSIKDQAQALGISPNIRFLGSRPDVPRILCGAMDAFLFPSQYEGLGLAVVEAQLAGLPVLMSDAITQEVDLGNGLIDRISLSLGPEQWATALLEKRPRLKSAALQFSDSVAKFDVVRSARRLCLHYDFVTALKQQCLVSSPIL